MENLQFGVDYYPEHWDEERWSIDLSMMKEMGITVVRLAEFSWSALEPAEGAFSFEWLAKVLDLCAAFDLKVVLGTPTAAPPAWVIEKMPDIQPMASDGARRYFGGRHHDCQSHPGYREQIKQYVTAFASHFGAHPQVIGWQVDNELGNSHGDLCYCSYCEAAFRQWLEGKYGTIEAVNQNWGTTFWSQDYQSFTQIHAPKNTASGQNPSRALDWQLFHSDLINEFHSFQAQIIREHSPNRFITHNLMGFSNVVNYHDLAKQLEFVSHDQYLEGYWRNYEKDKVEENYGTKRAFAAAELDFIRSIKKAGFWIMEQQSSISGWDILGRTPKPGEISLWTVQSVAHGADTIVYFRWRSCKMGTEQYWHGILPHSGIPGRSYFEIKTLIQKIKPLMKEVKGILPKPKVAIVHSYAQHYAMQIQPHHPDLNYLDHLYTYYRELYQRNIAVDFVQELEDWSPYQLVIAPLQYLMSPEQAQHYTNFVEKGGHLVVTMRTGVKERNNLCLIDQALPGDLSAVFGVEVHEYDCLRDVDVQVQLEGEIFTGSKWADILTPTSAEVIATYASEFYAKEAAITVHSYGKGKAYYVGTELDRELMHRFMNQLADVLPETLITPPGVEIISRENEQVSYYFVMNHQNKDQAITIPEDWEAYYPEQDRNMISANQYQVYKKMK